MLLPTQQDLLINVSKKKGTIHTTTILVKMTLIKPSVGSLARNSRAGQQQMDPLSIHRLHAETLSGEKKGWLQELASRTRKNTRLEHSTGLQAEKRTRKIRAPPTSVFSPPPPSSSRAALLRGSGGLLLGVMSDCQHVEWTNCV